MSYVDKSSFLSHAFSEEDFSIPDVGIVRLRGLTRIEVMNLKADHSKSETPFSETELHLFSIAVIDPQMSVEDWREIASSIPGGKLEALSDRIGILSGLIKQKEIAKETIKRFQ